MQPGEPGRISSERSGDTNMTINVPKLLHLSHLHFKFLIPNSYKIIVKYNYNVIQSIEKVKRCRKNISNNFSWSKMQGANKNNGVAHNGFTVIEQKTKKRLQ